MTARFEFDRHTTFALAGELSFAVDGVEVEDMTGFTLASHLRDRKGALIAELTAEWLDPVQRTARIYFDGDASGWPLGLCRLNIRATAPSGAMASTEDAHVVVMERATR